MKNLLSKYAATIVALCSVLAARSELAVTASKPQTIGNKSVVKLTMVNGFSEKIESARAATFLTDGDGKVVGQGTRWVIGGSLGTPGLAAGATNIFNFVVTADTPFATTNLTAKVTFSRIVLEGDKLADPNRDVRIQN